MSFNDSTPTPAQLAEARDRGYAAQAAINGVDPDAIVNHMPAYHTQCDQRSGRLDKMRDEILAQPRG